MVMAVIVGDDNPNTLEGTEQGDLISGLGGGDMLFGYGGGDVLRGGPGGDFLSGGDGIDMVDYEFSASAVIVSLGPWRPGISDSWTGDAQGDSIFGVENVLGSVFDDQLTGNEGDNVI